MLDNLTYGPHGYSTHEESFAAENEYHSNHSGSMQMMPPSHHSKQHMFYTSGTHGSGGWHGQGKTNSHSNGWQASQAQAGWSSSNAGHSYYNHAQAGRKFAGMHGPGGRISSNNTMMRADYESYHAGPGRMKTQNYGMHCESYDDYVNVIHGGRQNVGWKAM